MREYHIHMADVLCLLNIGYPSGKTNFNIPCPYCDSGRKKGGKHLNISLQKDMYNCPKCGFSGGMAALYAFYCGCSKEEAWERIRAELSAPTVTVRKSSKTVYTNTDDFPTESSLAAIEVRDKTYRLLLEMLTLSSDHFDNLRNRGLTDMEIERLGYRTSIPYGCKAITEKLIEAGTEVKGVPGFYQDKDGAWTFIRAKRGILIPMRDLQGRIQGLHLRLDKPIEDRKFLWFSSAGYREGCGAKNFPNFSGKPNDVVLLTEGGMKGDIIHSISGMTVIGMPGVNALEFTRPVLTNLKEIGTQRIMTVFDMDMFRNHVVMKAYKKLCQMIEEIGLPYGTYLWDPRYKGLDDYLHAMNQQENNQNIY